MIWGTDVNNAAPRFNRRYETVSFEEYTPCHGSQRRDKRISEIWWLAAWSGHQGSQERLSWGCVRSWIAGLTSLRSTTGGGKQKRKNILYIIESSLFSFILSVCCAKQLKPSWLHAYLPHPLQISALWTAAAVTPGPPKDHRWCSDTLRCLKAQQTTQRHPHPVVSASRKLLS